MERVRPFYCGTQKADWLADNCGNCHKGYNEKTDKHYCQIEEALDQAYFGDGYIESGIAARMGMPEVWRCREQDPIYAPERFAAHYAPPKTVMRPLYWRVMQAVSAAWEFWIKPWDREDHECYEGLRSPKLAWDTAWRIWHDAKMVDPAWVRPSLGPKLKEATNA